MNQLEQRMRLIIKSVFHHLYHGLSSIVPIGGSANLGGSGDLSCGPRLYFAHFLPTFKNSPLKLWKLIIHHDVAFSSKFGDVAGIMNVIFMLVIAINTCPTLASPRYSVLKPGDDTKVAARP